ncbi:hypothetical protein REPUB_Repub06bG0010400 [Reevesia pubescens]
MEMEKNKSKLAIDKKNNINGEFLTKEDYSAALCLASLKHVKLDQESAVTLDKLRTKALRQIKGKDKLEEGGEEEEDPLSIQDEPSSGIDERPLKFSTILNNFRAPDFPPVPALASIIGEYSRPCEKRLTDTDLRDSQIRVSLTKSVVQKSMLPMLKDKENVMVGIPVTTYDSQGNNYSMVFKVWTHRMYVLTTAGWKKFYKKHRLEKHIDMVKVWMFRHRVTKKLCFLITTRRSPLPLEM